MHFKKLGACGLTVSRIGFGCAQLGSKHGGYTTLAQAQYAIEAAIDGGINYFDAADVYGERNAEKWLGQILQKHRDRVIIGTKAGLTGDGRFNGSPVHLNRCLENSLRLLKTDHVDIFFLHRQDPQVPIAESLEAIADCVRQGKVRCAGVSNLDTGAIDCLEKRHFPFCAQYPLNFFDNDLIRRAAAKLRPLDCGILSYSPFASGWILRAKYADLAANRRPYFSPGFYRPEFPLYRRLKRLGDKHGIAMHQLALGWIFQRADSDTVIVGSSRAAQIRGAIEMMNRPLPPELATEVERIVSKVQNKDYLLRRGIWHTGVKISALLRRRSIRVAGSRPKTSALTIPRGVTVKTAIDQDCENQCVSK